MKHPHQNKLKKSYSSFDLNSNRFPAERQNAITLLSAQFICVIQNIPSLILMKFPPPITISGY